jgi:hypothetical protein
MRHKGLLALVLIGIALPLGGCGGAAEDESAGEPARVEEVAGQTQVVLSAEAAKRLDVQTTPVRSAAGKKTVIPFAAVLYDPNGETWTYTSPKPLVFVRHDISVDRIDGNRAILSTGPPAGTSVVTVGATEIWGVEYGGIEED